MSFTAVIMFVSRQLLTKIHACFLYEYQIGVSDGNALTLQTPMVTVPVCLHAWIKLEPQGNQNQSHDAVLKRKEKKCLIDKICRKIYVFISHHTGYSPSSC